MCTHKHPTSLLFDLHNITDTNASKKRLENVLFVTAVWRSWLPYIFHVELELKPAVKHKHGLILTRGVVSAASGDGGRGAVEYM